MSRTDKTRPYRIKLAEADQTDPYGIKREASIMWRRGLASCPLGKKCMACGGWARMVNRRDRQQGKREARDWALR